MKYLKGIGLLFILLSGFLAVIAGCSSAPGENGKNNGGSSSSSNSSVETAPGIFVSTNGNDTNSGGKNSPVLSFERAIELAASNSYTNIYAAAGTYTVDNGLSASSEGIMITNSGLRLSGGYTSDFKGKAGLSILDGTNRGGPTILAESVSNFILEGFMIVNSTGGGVTFDGVTGSRITNCEIVSNSFFSGGGLSVNNSSNNIFNCTISYNQAFGGGGVYLGNAFGNTINCTIFSNTGAAGGGGLILSSSCSNTVSGIITGNGGSEGGGLLIYGSSNNTISAAISSNSASIGGGVYMDTSAFNTISNVAYNSASGMGGGWYLSDSGFNTNVGTISFNSNYGIATNSGCSGNAFGTLADNAPENFTNF